MKISKLTALFLSVVLFFTTNLIVYATETATTQPPVVDTTQIPLIHDNLDTRGIMVYYNGKMIKTTLKPKFHYFDSNTLILPLKEIATLTKATFTWVPKTGKATYKLGNNNLQLTAGKSTATLNGKSIKLKGKHIVKNGIIFCDLDFITEYLGLKASSKLGYDKSNNNIFSHVVSLTTYNYKGLDPLSSVSSENPGATLKFIPIVDRGYDNSYMSAEEEAKWYNLYDKIPTATDNNGNLPTQVFTTGTRYMMSMTATTADSFRPEIVIAYEKEGLITIEIGAAPNNWDHFFEKTLTHLIGTDGTTIAKRLNKEIWSGYDAKENYYTFDNIIGTFKVGKYTVNKFPNNENIIKITWK